MKKSFKAHFFPAVFCLLALTIAVGALLMHTSRAQAPEFELPPDAEELGALSEEDNDVAEEPEDSFTFEDKSKADLIEVIELFEFDCQDRIENKDCVKRAKKVISKIKAKEDSESFAEDNPDVVQAMGEFAEYYLSIAIPFECQGLKSRVDFIASLEGILTPEIETQIKDFQARECSIDTVDALHGLVLDIEEQTIVLSEAFEEENIFEEGFIEEEEERPFTEEEEEQIEEVRGAIEEFCSTLKLKHREECEIVAEQFAEIASKPLSLDTFETSRHLSRYAVRTYGEEAKDFFVIPGTHDPYDLLNLKDNLKFARILSGFDAASRKAIMDFLWNVDEETFQAFQDVLALFQNGAKNAMKLMAYQSKGTISEFREFLQTKAQIATLVDELKTEEKIPQRYIPFFTEYNFTQKGGEDILGLLEEISSGEKKLEPSAERDKEFSELSKKSTIGKAESGLTSFLDLDDSHWAWENVEICKREGICRGKTDTEGNFIGFDPGGQTTNAEALKIFLAGFGIPEAKEGDPQFRHWASKYIKQCRDLGYSLCKDSNFDPNKPITRALMLQLLAEIMDIKPIEVNESSFIDVPRNHPQLGVIETFRDRGLVEGDVGRRKFRPNDPLTRAEFVTIFERAKDILGFGVINSYDQAEDDEEIKL